MAGHTTEKVQLQKINDNMVVETEDLLAVEEPLEIQLLYNDAGSLIRKNISVTMRTPGNDTELALGFLFTEGIIHHRRQVKEIKPLVFDTNTIMVTLYENEKPKLQNIERNFYTTSSCGVCGKASIDAIRTTLPVLSVPDQISIAASALYSLPDKLRIQQDVFESTGGLHAAALFDLTGNFITLREDVGRHNALDKLIGAAFLQSQQDADNVILLLSGRASFELVQKAAMAGIKIIAAVGAPSSLAVELAKDCGITLAGFLRGNRFNIYSNPQRIVVGNAQ
ncbi:formate dehydrogenase accessory sulfurtransferase FdhD [Chitinophagaceae bacterium MMS25-I14]